jgi:ribosomal protein S18 acetylase RimI-like enzyme
MSRNPSNTGELTIRPAVAGDAAAMAEVHVACWRETYAGMIPDRVLAMLDVEARRHMWKRAIRQAGSDTFVCVRALDGTIAGFAECGPRRDVPEDYDAEVLAIYLLQLVQGRGVGRTLMRVMAEAMLERGGRSMALRVACQSEGARAFYERLGGTDAGKPSHQVDDYKIVTTVYGWPDVSVLL